MNRIFVQLVNFFVAGIIISASYPLQVGAQNHPTGNALDTITYNVMVAVDQSSITHFGGEEQYREKLNSLFEKVNSYWNEAGSGRFNYYFIFSPELQIVYNGSSKVIEQAMKASGGLAKYDILMLIDSKSDFDDEHPGWYCGGSADGLSLAVFRGRSKKETEDLFSKDYFYKGIAHEFGHSRGVTDLYADKIDGKKNPINGKEYKAEECVMNSHYTAMRWSDYAVAIINYTAPHKRLGRDLPNLFHNLFPQNIDIEVLVEGKKQPGVKLNLYGSRARHNDLIATPYRSYVTDVSGRCLITNVPQLYDKPAPPTHVDDLPWNRWFTFLLEAEYKGKKEYVWLPEYKLQQLFFEGKKTYQVTINL